MAGELLLETIEALTGTLFVTRQGKTNTVRTDAGVVWAKGHGALVWDKGVAVLFKARCRCGHRACFYDY